MDTSEANFFILPDGSYDPFWEAIRNRCKKVYEDDPSLTRTSGWGTYLFHMALLLVVQPLIFYYGYLQEWALWSHLSAFAMGIVVWVGGRLGHDAGHYAVCPKKYYSGWFTAICSGFALTNIGYVLWFVLCIIGEGCVCFSCLFGRVAVCMLLFLLCDSGVRGGLCVLGPSFS
jgi:hypothetical protein